MLNMDICMDYYYHYYTKNTYRSPRGHLQKETNGNQKPECAHHV